MRVSCLGLLLAASVMAGCSAQSPSVARTPTPYDYGAVCDFTFARLFDLNARISDAQKSSIEQLHGVPTKFPIFLYRDTTASVRYVQLANGNHVLDASLLPNAIYFTDHDKAHLLGRLGFVNNQPSQVSADCEFFSLQLRFSGSQLERVQITGRAPD